MWAQQSLLACVDILELADEIEISDIRFDLNRYVMIFKKEKKKEEENWCIISALKSGARLSTAYQCTSPKVNGWFWFHKNI